MKMIGKSIICQKKDVFRGLRIGKTVRTQSDEWR